MAVAKLKISKSGVSGILVLRWFKDHTWHLESPVSWFPATSGKWAQVRNATKFRQFSFLRITNEEGQSIAHFREPPYIILQKFTANLTSRSSGDPFDVEVVCSFLLDPMCSSAGRPSIGDDVKIANNNFADSPDRGDPHWIKSLGATIFEVKTPQNAVLTGQNKCIDDGAIGVYGQSDGTTGGIGVTGACDQGCGVAGIARLATADLPPASAGVYGRGDFHGVYGVGAIPSG